MEARLQSILNKETARKNVLQSQFETLQKQGATLQDLERLEGKIYQNSVGRNRQYELGRIKDINDFEILKKTAEERKKIIFSNQTDSISSLLDKNPDLNSVRKAQTDLFKASAYLSDKEFSELSGQLEKYLSKTNEKRIADLKKSKDLIEEIGKKSVSVFSDLQNRANSNNPFVTLFSEANNSLKTLRENLKGLPTDFQRVAIASQQAINRNKLFETRLDNNLSAFDLRESANRFRTSGEKDTRTEADYIKLFGQSDFFKGNLGASNINSAAAFLANRRFAGDENLSLNDRLQKQLSIINSAPANESERGIADRRLMGLTSGLDPSQIKAELREQIGAANEREAVRKERYESELLKVQQEDLTIQKRIADAQEKLLKIAEKDGLEGLNNYLEITLKDGTGRANIIGSSGTQDDVRSTYFNESN